MHGSANAAFCWSAVHPVNYELIGPPHNLPPGVSSVGAERSLVLYAGACTGQPGKSGPHYPWLTGFLQMLQVLAGGDAAEGATLDAKLIPSRHASSAGASAMADTSQTSAYA